MAAKAFYSVLAKDETLSEVLIDCEQAFNCRNIPSKGNQDYSVGATYFLKANDTPKCNLELLAKQVFDFHTNGMELDASNSGAEWWTQVIDSRDDIGFHWDRDYGAEEVNGTHIYPNLGTVTYLSDLGGPTLVFNKSGTCDSSVPIIGQTDSFTASKPIMCKHITFNGALLHAAPSDLTEPDEDDNDDQSEGSDESEGSDDVDAVNRVTFLVNIWINHIPSQSKRFPAKQLSKFQTFNPAIKMCFTNPPPAAASTEVPLTAATCARTKKWKFSNSDVNYEVHVPLPEADATIAILEVHDMINFTYIAPKAAEKSVAVEIIYSEDQSGSEGESDEEDGDESEGSEGSDENDSEEESSDADEDSGSEVEDKDIAIGSKQKKSGEPDIASKKRKL